MSTIGIIGAGNIGRAIRSDACAQGHCGDPVQQPRPGEPGERPWPRSARSVTAGTREQAAAKDIVFVAVNWSKLPAALAEPAGHLAGRTVVDANNPIEAPLFKPAELGGRASSEIFADLVPGARVVKAFNHLPGATPATDPASDGGKRVLFYSGDDTGAKAAVGGADRPARVLRHRSWLARHRWPG